MKASEATDKGDPSLDVFERMLKLCDTFEDRWRRGENPRIEEFVAPHEWASRVDLFRELLALELELARSQGQAPDAGAYRGRFPDLVTVIEEVFADAGTRTAGPRSNRPGRTNHFPAIGPPNTSAATHPTRIGRYSVLSLLDEGGQGQIFRVVHPGLKKDLVLKLATRRIVGDDASRELLAAEGRLLAQLDHPNLIRVLDLDVNDEGRPFLVMEYVPGCSLERHIEQGLPTARQAAALVAEIARAVAYVHGKGVVHQDIKPRNVLIDEFGRPRLIDFGLARLRHAWADDISGPSGGTLMFMAPEQARGEIERVGPAADIYALGGLLFFLLTGKPPHGIGERPWLLERARCGAVDRSSLEASGASKRLQRICLRALSPETTNRHASANELAEQLEQAGRVPRRDVLLAAVALPLIAVLAALGLHSGTGRSVQPLVGVTEDQELIHIVGEYGPLALREVLPLRTGAQLWCSCRVPHGSYAALFWVDSEGQVEELKAEVVPGVTADTLRYPAPGVNDVVRLQGPPGTEALLVCGRRDRPVTQTEIAKLLGAAGSLPALPDQVMVVIRSDGVEPSGRSGSRSLTAPEPSHLSAALAPLRALQSGLRSESSFLSGIAFPHVAE